jgi:hypothetical protein
MQIELSKTDMKRHAHDYSCTAFRRLQQFCCMMLAAGMLFSSCSTPTPIADEIVFGAEPDEITAKVDGASMTFAVGKGTNYFGIHTSGVSGANSIGLHLGGGSPGTMMWTAPHTMMDSDPAASWNGMDAIKGLGYLNIIHNERACVSGTFEFMTIDPETKDTIRITDGTFRVHYVTTD